LSQLFRQLHATPERHLERQTPSKRPPQSATVIDVEPVEERA